MGMVKLQPSQNQNPLTDYDKTLHNWLSPRDERVTKNLCQSALRVRLGKYVKYKAKFFLFFPGLAYWSDPWADFHAQWLKLRAITQGSAFLGSARWPTTFRCSFRGQIPPKPATSRQMIDHFLREVDDNEAWRQWWRDARLRCCKCIVQGQTTGHSFTACMLVIQRESH